MTQQIITIAIVYLLYATRFLRAAAPAWAAIQVKFPRVPAWAYPVVLVALEQLVAVGQGTATPESLAAALGIVVTTVMPGAAAKMASLFLIVGGVGCAALLSGLPPQTSVCVSVSAWDVEAEACGSNDEPVAEIKERAVALAKQRIAARDGGAR